MHGDAQPETDRAERAVEERIRQDAVALGAERGADFELGGVGLGAAGGECDLAARNRDRVQDQVRRGFPQPVPHLIVEGLHLTRLHDVNVVPQAVEQLRPVGLRVGRLQLVVLDEDVVLVVVDDRTGNVGSRTDGMGVGTVGAGPDTRHRAKGTEVREGVVAAFGLGIDVGAVVVDVAWTGHRRRITLRADRENWVER